MWTLAGEGEGGATLKVPETSIIPGLINEENRFLQKWVDTNLGKCSGTRKETEDLAEGSENSAPYL